VSVQLVTTPETTEQFWVLQGCDCIKSDGVMVSEPLPVGDATIARARVLTPPPHSALFVPSREEKGKGGGGGRGESIHSDNEHEHKTKTIMTRSNISNLQGDHTLQSDKVALVVTLARGQAWVLHVVCSRTFVGHAAPPFNGGLKTDRERIEMPPPHCAEQVDHTVQLDMTHATGVKPVLGGHPCTLHGSSCSTSVGHGVPPLAGDTTTDRVCCCTPPPHVLEHALHALQPPMVQGTTGTPGLRVGSRHTCVLHATLDGMTLVAGSGHARPPLAAGVSTARASICTPPPHALEQLPEGTKALMTQSTETAGGARVGGGHACVLHGVGETCTFNDGSGHGCPPLAAGTTTVWSIICTPPPQATVQLPEGVGALMTQSTGTGGVVGHGSVLHGVGDGMTLDDGSGHALPPLAAGRTTDRDKS
jgi:hypothetical protein